jgi:hypothetical protein
MDTQVRSQLRSQQWGHRGHAGRRVHRGRRALVDYDNEGFPDVFLPRVDPESEEGRTLPSRTGSTTTKATDPYRRDAECRARRRRVQRGRGCRRLRQWNVFGCYRACRNSRGSGMTGGSRGQYRQHGSIMTTTDCSILLSPTISSGLPRTTRCAVPRNIACRAHQLSTSMNALRSSRQRASTCQAQPAALHPDTRPALIPEIRWQSGEKHRALVRRNAPVPGPSQESGVRKSWVQGIAANKASAPTLFRDTVRRCIKTRVQLATFAARRNSPPVSKRDRERVISPKSFRASLTAWSFPFVRREPLFAGWKLGPQSAAGLARSGEGCERDCARGEEPL